MTTVPVLDSPFAGSEIKVRQSILSAANRLMADASFEKMTVSAICKEAHVSRQTFYDHFKDKNDLVIWLEAGIVTSHLEKIGITLSWEQAIEGILAGLASNAVLLAAGIAASSQRAAFHSGCARIISDSLIRELEWDRKTPMTSDLLFQCQTFPVALIALADSLLMPKGSALTESEVKRAEREAKANLPLTARRLLAYVPGELKAALSSNPGER